MSCFTILGARRVTRCMQTNVRCDRTIFSHTGDLAPGNGELVFVTRAWMRRYIFHSYFCCFCILSFHVCLYFTLHLFPVFLCKSDFYITRNLDFVNFYSTECSTHYRGKTRVRIFRRKTCRGNIIWDILA